jgi:hypothetical protein
MQAIFFGGWHIAHIKFNIDYNGLTAFIFMRVNANESVNSKAADEDSHVGLRRRFDAKEAEN